MGKFVDLMTNFYRGIFNELSSALITWSEDSAFGVISVGSILFACIVLGFAISAFWKGVRTK